MKRGYVRRRQCRMIRYQLRRYNIIIIPTQHLIYHTRMYFQITLNSIRRLRRSVGLLSDVLQVVKKEKKHNVLTINYNNVELKTIDSISMAVDT